MSVWVSAVYDWGVLIGRARFLNGEPLGSARGSGLRGNRKLAFEKGLRKGFTLAKSECEHDGRHK